MSSLQDKKILVGVCGSVAAYKACELVRLLRREGAAVTVAMTRSATHFVGPTTFAALTGNQVITDQFPVTPAAGEPHVDIARSYDAVVVAPATANMLGKTAHAIADDFLSTVLSIADCPILYVPAMHTHMWRNPATQDAVSRLRGWGRQVLEPEVGELASMETGEGRFPAPERILSEIRQLLDIPQLLRGRKVLVTAGPTREAIDPVRYISNRSSGKMGYALAAAALSAGAEVTLVSGPVALNPPAGCRLMSVQSAEEMLSTLLEAAPGHDLLLMAAAVADFRAAEPAEQKLRRTDETTSVELIPTPDILKAIRSKFQGTLVAFALEPTGSLDSARQKLRDKQADYVVVNPYDEPGVGMEADANHVWLLSAEGEELELPTAPKEVLARQILQYLTSRREPAVQEPDDSVA
jgi:phosphopantothenoylcysteine decarboxylase/phosphopantothenate--cysteine ligase